MLDENKWLASRHGLEGELVDLPDRATGSPPRRSRSGSWTACASTRRTSARAELEGIKDLLRTGTGRSGSARCYEANRDFSELLEDIVEASGPLAANWRRDGRAVGVDLDSPHEQRPRPLPRLQELWRRGVSVHHGVPLLRHAHPEARAQARSRRGAQGVQARQALAPAAPAAAPGRDPGHPRRPPRVGRLGARAGAGDRHARAQDAPRRGSMDLTYGAGFDDPWRAVHVVVRLRLRPATRPSRSARSRSSAGCWRSATAGGRSCWSSWCAAPAARTSPSRSPARRRARRERRRAGPARARGRCATSSAAGAAARTTATCWACWRSRPSSCCCRWCTEAQRHRGHRRRRRRPLLVGVQS